MPVTDEGHGCSITFGTSAFTGVLLAVNGYNFSRPAIETSKMSTSTNHTFMPADLVDRGEIELEFEFDPSLTPPIASATETVTITFPVPSGLSTGATWAASAFMTNYAPAARIGERMQASATLKVSGAVTITPAA